MTHRPSWFRGALLAASLAAAWSCDPSSLLPGAGGGKDSANDQTPGDGTGQVDTARRPGAMSGFAAASGGALAASLTWSAPPTGVDHILVAILPEGDSWRPTDGVSYAAGQIVGSGSLLWRGSGSGCSLQGFAVGQACRFVAFTANSLLLYSEPAESRLVVPAPAPAYSGFDISLSEGSFWEYDYLSVSGSYGSYFTFNQYFAVVLGVPQQRGDKLAFPLSIPDPPWSYAPRWSWLAESGGCLYGSVDGESWTTIFDPVSGIWKGGGFFVARDAALYSTSGPYTLYDDGSAVAVVAVGSSVGSSSASYVFVPDYGYVSDGQPDMSWNTAEYFRPGFGPYGYDNSFSYTDPTVNSYKSESVRLVGSSFAGDSLELAGSSYPSAVRRLGAAGWTFGHAQNNWEAQDAMTAISYRDGTSLVSAAPFHDFYYFESAAAVDMTVEVRRLVGNPNSSWPAFSAVVIALDSDESPILSGPASASRGPALPPLPPLDLGPLGIGSLKATVLNDGNRSSILGGYTPLDIGEASFAAVAGGRYLLAVYVPDGGDVRYKARVR
jgi:hypothetical protein